MLFKHVSIWFWNTCPYAFETHVYVLFGIMKKASWKAEGATSGKYQTKSVRYRPDVTFNRNHFRIFKDLFKHSCFSNCGITQYNIRIDHDQALPKHDLKKIQFLIQYKNQTYIILLYFDRKAFFFYLRFIR